MILKSQDSVSKVLWNSNQKPISSSFWTFSSITKDYKKRKLGSATSVCNELDGLFSTCVRFVLDVGLDGKSAVLKCSTIVKRLQSYEWSFTLVADFSLFESCYSANSKLFWSLIFSDVWPIFVLKMISLFLESFWHSSANCLSSLVQRIASTPSPHLVATIAGSHRMVGIHSNRLLFTCVVYYELRSAKSMDLICYRLHRKKNESSRYNGDFLQYSHRHF